MRGIDATSGWTHEVTGTVIVTDDHFAAVCVDVLPTARGTRFAAGEPLHLVIRAHFDGHRHQVATGLALCHDRGSQVMRNPFQTELRFLGTTGSPACVREPKGNGSAERFICTHKEQLLRSEGFDGVDAPRQALLAFKDTLQH